MKAVCVCIGEMSHTEKTKQGGEARPALLAVLEAARSREIARRAKNARRSVASTASSSQNALSVLSDFKV